MATARGGVRRRGGGVAVVELSAGTGLAGTAGGMRGTEVARASGARGVPAGAAVVGSARQAGRQLLRRAGRQQPGDEDQRCRRDSIARRDTALAAGWAKRGVAR